MRWLIANLGTAMVGSLRSSALFGGAIETMVALAVLMPIVASIGGNAGTQTLAVTVRALATNQLTAVEHDALDLARNPRRLVDRRDRCSDCRAGRRACLCQLAAGRR